MTPLHIGKARDLQKIGDRRIYRLFEILPGFLSWGTILTVIICSFIIPKETAVFVIIFDVYWLTKTLYLSLHLRYGYAQIRKNMKVDWLEKVRELGITNKELRWGDLYHLIILPTYQESVELIIDSLDSLVKSNYPKDKFIVVLAQEGRAGAEHNQAVASALQAKYASVFHSFLTVVHPQDIAGEVAGKGANITWAGRQVKKAIIDEKHIPYESILVSVFDIDTVVLTEYFGRLTYTFLSTPNRLRASYQPIPFFINNIWEAPALARLVAFSSTFWQTIQQERPENLITFSSHSMPFQAVVDIDFWQTNMVSEDSRVFWQCLMRYDGDYRVIPLYFPVSMDANTAPTFRQTMVNVYKQHRRWGYGAENVPYFLFGFLKNKKMALSKKLFFSFTVIEGYWSWATNAIILFLLGWLPGLLGGPGFNGTILSFNHSILSQNIMRLAMLALITPLVLSFLIMPPKPSRLGRFTYVWMTVQWIIFPFTTIFFGAFPGLDAQTRLMLGKYMGFWVTPKHRRAVSTSQSTNESKSTN